jgi:hypothetical protein
MEDHLAGMSKWKTIQNGSNPWGEKFEKQLQHETVQSLKTACYIGYRIC